MLERQISEAKDEGKTIPGRIPIPGIRSYLWNLTILYVKLECPKAEGEKILSGIKNCFN